MGNTTTEDFKDESGKIIAFGQLGESEGRMGKKLMNLKEKGGKNRDS